MFEQTDERTDTPTDKVEILPDIKIETQVMTCINFNVDLALCTAF